MPLTIAGRNLIAAAIVGDSYTPYNNANARIGVGDGTTAFNQNQTDLQGTNRFRKGMDASYPTRSANVMTFRATFGTSEANFAWQEWGIFNAATGGEMLCRAVEYKGTKTSDATWVATATITLNIS